AEQDGKRERLRRLLLIVPAARRRPGIKLPELASELGLDAQELREDIDLLGLVGRPPFSPDDLIDISVDERDRVTVTLDQSFSRPPQLTPLEALALAAAALEAAPADPAVASALAKLTRNLTPKARQLYAQLAQRIAGSTPAPRGVQSILAQLRSAAEQHRELVLEYDKEGRGAAGERVFRPQGVIDHRGVWYVIGHDVGRGAERTFRVDRILSVRETGQTFPDQGPLDPARFQREQLFFPSGHEHAVTLRFSPAAAAWALQRYGSRARQLQDGRVDVSIESAGTGYAVQLALSLAGEAEIAGPQQAREALRDEVERALRRSQEIA
ncbi:MAG TPA: WYL domain-containing protein, partial [Myxococcales bacterium]|nr:WYL domain-containing protein [Myxococcales bacterium]